jgi:transitional endoplasmic reticulum ATPase
MAIYLLACLAIVAVYVAASSLLWVTRDFTDHGPLAFDAPAVTTPLDASASLPEIRQGCIATGNLDLGAHDAVKIVAARFQGQTYYACYQIKDAEVFTAAVIDADGVTAPTAVVKRLGAWPYVGLVKSTTDLVMGGLAVAVMLGLFFVYYRRPRPGPPVPARWWQTPLANGLLGTAGVLPLTLPFRRVESFGRRMRLLYRFGFGWITGLTCLFGLGALEDRMGAIVLGLIGWAEVFGWWGGRSLVRAEGFGRPDEPTPKLAGRRAQASGRRALTAGRTPETGNATTGGMPALTGRVPGSRKQAVAHPLPPTRLPTFADVGGMVALKDELADTLGLLLAFGDEADTFRIQFNGILLHGPPGVGKTFIAKATAGEFGLHFAHLSTGDLVSTYVGESAANLRRAFADAARHVPCLLFFDEFDSIAQRRDGGQSEESRRVVNQLLQSLEDWRPVRDLIIMAATNHVDTLDPAVVRAGRFDRLIRVDLPDLPARRAILTTQLAGRPTAPDIDVDDLAERMVGRTPATIARVVEAASMAAFRRVAAEAGAPSPICHQDLRAALDSLGGTDRPMVEAWNWDRLILPEAVTAELKQVQSLVADPDRAKAYGVEVPSGLLLAGPPGTGKTTVARVLAAQGRFSFYPITAADLTSKWVGESEASVVRLFERARANAPAIIFIDEIDALAGKRFEGSASYLDRTLTQLLTEIDGMVDQRGVFVMAATNRPDVLDPALLRGGRLSRTITIPLPDQAGRRRMLEIFTRRMPLDRVDLDALAGQTQGLSGADLEAVCQQAAVNAMIAADASPAAPRAVTSAAFAQALRQRPHHPDALPPDAQDPDRNPDRNSGVGPYL